MKSKRKISSLKKAEIDKENSWKKIEKLSSDNQVLGIDVSVAQQRNYQGKWDC